MNEGLQRLWNDFAINFPLILSLGAPGRVGVVVVASILGPWRLLPEAL
jgi:hypothetical protein